MMITCIHVESLCSCAQGGVHWKLGAGVPRSLIELFSHQLEVSHFQKEIHYHTIHTKIGSYICMAKNMRMDMLRETSDDIINTVEIIFRILTSFCDTKTTKKRRDKSASIVM